MKRRIWALVLLAAIPSTAQASGPAAGTLEPSEEGVPLERIEKVLKAYAETLGCEFKFDPKNVVEFDMTGDQMLQRYVALFFLDTGCTGGSGMGNSLFAVLEQGPRGEVLVQPELSQPTVPSFGFPRFIERIFVKGNQLWYSGKVPDWSRDAPNFPSVPVEGQVLLRKGVVNVDMKTNFGARYWLSRPKH